MISIIFNRARFFGTSSRKALKLAQAARRVRKENRGAREQDSLIEVMPTEQERIVFDKRPIPKGFRLFLQDVHLLANDEVKKAYSFENGTPREILFSRKMELVKKFGKNEKDTGHPAVQVGIFTEKIMFLASHVRMNNTDTLAYLNLRQTLERRRKAMQYLGRYDYHLYVEVCDYLGINKLNYPQHKEVKNLKFK